MCLHDTDVETGGEREVWGVEEAKMKENHDQNQSSHRHGGQKTKSGMARFFTFGLVFFLGYVFGFFLTPRSPTIFRNSLPCPKVDATKHHQRPYQKQKQKPPHDLFEFRMECAPPIPQAGIIPTIFSKLYNDTSPYLNFPPPHLSPVLRRRRGVRGWGSTASVFETLIQSTRPKTIIEVGTFLGASTLHMANLTRAVDLPNTLILCLDDFRGWPGFRDLHNGLFKHLVDVNGDVILMQQFMQNVADAGEESRILPVPFSTGAGLEALCEWGVYGDLVEVDAGHDFHSAWADINRAWKVVSPGGVMFGHDYNLAKDGHGVRRAVDLFAKVQGLKVQRDGQHWVLGPPKPFPAPTATAMNMISS